MCWFCVGFALGCSRFKVQSSKCSLFQGGMVAQQLQLRYSPERHLEPASLTLRVPPSVFLILRLVTQGWFYTRPPCALKRSFRSFRSSSLKTLGQYLSRPWPIERLCGLIYAKLGDLLNFSQPSLNGRVCQRDDLAPAVDCRYQGPARAQCTIFRTDPFSFCLFVWSSNSI